MNATAVAAPAHRAASLWSRKLVAALRPEFLVSVIVPGNDDPILGSPECSVAGCSMPQHCRKLCAGHDRRFTTAGRPDWDSWVRQAEPTLKAHGKIRACAVPACRRGLAGNGLCTWHLRHWNADTPSGHDRDAWLLAQVVVDDGRPDCRIPGCPLQAESVENRLCRPHDGRRRQRGFPPMETFVELCATYGFPKFDLGQLAEPVRWEIAYGLQRRVDERRIKTQAKAIAPLLNWLARVDAGSLLDRPELDWRRDAIAALGQRGATDGFLRFTFQCLDDLQHGAGWETEYPRDVWQLRHLGMPDARTAQLRFDRITQPWLRILVKQWVRARMTTNVSMSAIAKGLTATARLSVFLQSAEPAMESSAQLTRPVLERFFASLAEHLLDPKTRGQVIGQVGTFLLDVRRHEWAPELAANAVIYPSDHPRRPAMASRALSEHMMAQLESPENLARFTDPGHRLITEILMRTGLRTSDACQLSSSCVTRDAQGAFYLKYVNHKMRREAYVPIDDQLAKAIQAQVDRIRQRWPRSTRLFPRTTTNPDGALPVGYVAYRAGLNRWLATCDVRDESGASAHVTPHQWRHTYGTRMINADVPQHIVKQLMDHSSDTMTAHYARLTQTTVRRHWEQAQRVNIHGEPVPVDPTSPLADAEWMKENLARAKMALPNGFCTLPLQKSCAHANACLTCPLFVTTAEFLPDHHRQLEATRALITMADSRGHSRLAESNRTVEKNLLRIITALDSPTGNCDASNCCSQPGQKGICDAR